MHLRTFTQYTIRCSLTVYSPGREWWGSWCLQPCPVFPETLQLVCNQVAPVIWRDKLSSPSSPKEDTVRTNTCALNYTAGLVKCISCGEFTIMDFTVTIVLHSHQHLHYNSVLTTTHNTSWWWVLHMQTTLTTLTHLQKIYKVVSFSATSFHTSFNNTTVYYAHNRKTT